MSKERRLGRGLEALLGRPLGSYQDSNDDAAPMEPAADGAGLVQVSVYEIDTNPFQPRRDFDAETISQLSDSIRDHGMVQPLLVRRVAGRYQLIAGERRLRAAIKAGWSDVPVQVRDADDRQMAELAIVENLQRKDLNPLEKAASFANYLDSYGCTQEDLAGRLKLDRSTIANLIRLLELPDEVQQSLRDGAISQGHARALLPLGEEREQVACCRRIQEEGLSVRAVEELVQTTIHSADDALGLSVVTSDGSRASAPRRSRRGGRASDHVQKLEQELRAALGTKVELRQAASGRGRITIHFSHADEFERLREQICGRAAARRAV